MKKLKIILELYVLFGFIMALYVSTVNSVFDILVIRGDMSVFQYVLFTGVFLGVFWLPYGLWMVLFRYSEYYVFSDKPIFIMLYILAFILLSLYIIFRKSKENSSQNGIDERQGNSLIKFSAVFILTVIFAVVSCFQLPEPTINKENIRSLSFAYGAGPSWHDAYNLNYRGDIDTVVDALVQLPLEPAKPCKLDNDLLASDKIEFVVAIHYEDIKTAKLNNEIGIYIILDNGHIIVEDFYRHDRHYKADYTMLQSVLKELEYKANIGFMRMSRND